MTEKNGNHPPEHQERHGNPADSQEKVVKLPELKEVHKGVIFDHCQEKTPGITKEQEAPDPGWREQEKKEDYFPQGRQRPKRRHFRSPPLSQCHPRRLMVWAHSIFTSISTGKAGNSSSQSISCQILCCSARIFFPIPIISVFSSRAFSRAEVVSLRIIAATRWVSSSLNSSWGPCSPVNSVVSKTPRTRILRVRVLPSRTKRCWALVFTTATLILSPGWKGHSTS